MPSLKFYHYLFQRKWGNVSNAMDNGHENDNENGMYDNDDDSNDYDDVII
jgi:hypothetical protein